MVENNYRPNPGHWLWLRSVTAHGISLIERPIWVARFSPDRTAEFHGTLDVLRRWQLLEA